MTITDRTRVAFADVQRLLSTGFYFDVERDDLATGEDGQPALITIEAHASRGKDDPLAFKVKVNEAVYHKMHGAEIADDQLRSDALHELLHAFRHPADKLGEYRLRAKERLAHSAAQEAAVYAEERTFAPLVNYWFLPLPVRVWRAIVRKPPFLDTL